MKPFNTEPTEYTPLLHFDPDNLVLRIEGVSRPEDVQDFYTPAINWINQMANHLNQREPGKIQVIFKLTYCNSSSFKFILQILEALLQVRDNGFTVAVDWYYEESDEQMLEDGEDIAEATELEFNFYPS